MAPYNNDHRGHAIKRSKPVAISPIDRSKYLRVHTEKIAVKKKARYLIRKAPLGS
jgi:hypothetical protein